MPVRSGPVRRSRRGWRLWAEPRRISRKKTLRQWKKARPVTGPLPSCDTPLHGAHDAFVNRSLRRFPRESGTSLSGSISAAAARRRGLRRCGPSPRRILAFLKWLKLNLSGQTALRVDGNWQANPPSFRVLRSSTPDHVFRRRTLQRGTRVSRRRKWASFLPLSRRQAPADGRCRHL